MGLSIIIPCYNESSRGNFKERINELMTFMSTVTFNYEVIFVDDGSTDCTYFDLIEIKANYYSMQYIKVKKNCGKGNAIKVGISFAICDFILIMDADLCVPLSYITEFYNIVSERNCIIGSRRLPDSVITIEQSKDRTFIGRLSRFCTKHLLGLNVNDTQCGFKMFPRLEYNKISEYIHSNRWLFDIELLIYLQALDLEVIEKSVTWGTNLESTLISNEAIKSSIKELLVILREKRKNVKEIKSKYL